MCVWGVVHPFRLHAFSFPQDKRLMCTPLPRSPSRASLMTGRIPFRVGIAGAKWTGGVFNNIANGGLPLNETALPEVLKAQVRRAQSRHPFRPYCALLPTALVALAGRARLSQRVTPRCHAATHATFLFAPLLSPP